MNAQTVAKNGNADFFIDLNLKFFFIIIYILFELIIFQNLLFLLTIFWFEIYFVFLLIIDLINPSLQYNFIIY